MVFSKALALKVLGGTLFLGSASTGIYFINDHIQNQLTVYDQALIDHLNVENADIKFAVLGSGDSALTTFPTTFEENPSSPSFKVKVKIQASEGSAETEGTITGNSSTENKLGSRSYLKNLNKVSGAATDWTWTCEIKLTKETGITGANELNTQQKEKIFKSDDSNSFLNKLKADSSANKEIKQLKQDFIRNCASARGTSINRGINGLENIGTAKEKLKVAENEIKSEKKFKLRKGSTSNDAWGGGKEEDSKLYFPNKWEFENWFKAKADQQPR